MLPHRYVCVGCKFNSDQALRLLCLKGHVRASDSTLWQYCWQEASEFFSTEIPLEGSWATKKIAKKTLICFLRRANNVTFSNFVADAAKKKPCSARYFATALRAVLINSLIRINSGPKILRSCFVHCCPYSSSLSCSRIKTSKPPYWFPPPIDPCLCQKISCWISSTVWSIVVSWTCVMVPGSTLKDLALNSRVT